MVVGRRPNFDQRLARAPDMAQHQGPRLDRVALANGHPEFGMLRHGFVPTRLRRQSAGSIMPGAFGLRFMCLLQRLAAGKADKERVHLLVRRVVSAAIGGLERRYHLFVQTIDLG